MFFSRQPKESPDEMASRLNAEGRLDELETELLRYKPDKLPAKEKERYYYWWGIMAFKRKDRKTAYERFKEGYRKCPDSVKIRFSLGQEHEARGEVDEMLACFDGCPISVVGPKYIIAAARFAFLWGRPEKSIEYLEPISEMYFPLGIADDHYVHSQGLPFFTETWSYLVSAAWMMGSYDFTDRFLDRAKAGLSHYDFDQLGLHYEAHKNKDYSDYIAWLSGELDYHDTRFPAGYRRVQLASLKAVSGEDHETAIADLEDITLGHNDFDWLEKVIAIQVARTQWKAGLVEAEAVARTKLLDRGSQLFEPDQAFAFAYLDYLEELLPLYRAARRADSTPS